MSVRTIQFLTRLSACTTDEQAALAIVTAIDEGIRPLRQVLEAGLSWCDANEPQRIESTGVQS